MRDIEQTEDFASMHDFLVKQNFEYMHEHQDILDWSVAYRFVKDDVTLGYVWAYQLAEEDEKFIAHMCIDKKYQGRVLTKHIVNKFYALMHEFGASVLLIESINNKLINLYKRIGWQQSSDQSVYINLPYQWRINHGK